MSIIGAHLLGKLKTIFKGNIHIHDLFHLTINTIHITQNSPPNAEPIARTAPDILTLNIDKFSALSSNQKSEIIAAIQEAVIGEGIPILNDKLKERLEDIAVIESDTEIIAQLEFFKGKLPSEDYAALRSAIYIKNKFDARTPHDEIFTLKQELREKFGSRGLKISKLWSSGYFKDWIKPIYCRFKQDSHFSDDDFLVYYNLIIEEEAFAVFVPSTMTSDQLESVIHHKIKRNLHYGIYFITIHGIGKECVDTIRGIIPMIEKSYEVINQDISEKHYIIRAKFWFKKL